MSQVDCDFHVHIFPEAAQADPEAWSLRSGEERWWQMVAGESASGPSRQGWAGPDDLIKEMDRARLQSAVLQGWYWEQASTARVHNETMAACLAHHSDRLYAFAALPHRATAAERIGEVEYAARSGFHGLGELCPSLLGESIVSSGWMPVWEAASAMGWPVCLHMSEPVGTHYRGKPDTPWSGIESLLRQVPGLRLVLAHWGGGLAFLEGMWSIRRNWENVWYDTAATPLIYQPGVWALVGSLIPAEKVVFGSDFPLLLYRRETVPGIARFAGEARAGVPDPALSRLVMGANAARLLETARRG